MLKALNWCPMVEDLLQKSLLKDENKKQATETLLLYLSAEDSCTQLENLARVLHDVPSSEGSLAQVDEKSSRHLTHFVARWRHHQIFVVVLLLSILGTWKGLHDVGHDARLTHDLCHRCSFFLLLTLHQSHSDLQTGASYVRTNISNMTTNGSAETLRLPNGVWFSLGGTRQCYCVLVMILQVL